MHACSQVIRLSVEGDVVQVHVDVRVVLTADPADGRAVERGARANVGLQAGQRLRLLGGHVDLWEFEGQRLGNLVEAAIWQCHPAEKRRRNGKLRREKVTQGRAFLHKSQLQILLREHTKHQHTAFYIER